jgi:hypothetical protein
LEKSFRKQHQAREGTFVLCELKSSHKVYIDDSDGTIFDARLNLTNVRETSTKFYYLHYSYPRRGLRLVK